MKIDLSFFANSIILFAIIIALTGFKIFSCKPFNENGEDFSWRKLLLGLLSNLGVLLILSFVYFVGAYFGADLAVIQIGEAKYTIQAMLNALIILAIGMYGVKLYKNAAAYFEITKEVKEANVTKTEISVVDYNLASDESLVEEKG